MDDVIEWPPLGHLPEMPLSDEALEDALRELAANVDAALWRLIALIVEFDRRGGWRHGGARSCAHWLSARCGIAVGAAREKLRVGRALRELPKTSDAFRCGALSYSKARAITRIANAENEDDLLGIAERGSASHLERLAAAHRRNVRAHEREAERLAGARVSDQRTLRWHTDETGMFCFSGKLSPEAGALFAAGIGRLEDVLEADRPVDGPDGAGLHADVSAETPPYEGEAEGRARRAGRRRADALALLMDTSLEAATAGAGTARNHTVNIIVDADALTDRDDLPERAESRCHVENGPALTIQAVRRMCCDGPLVGLLESGGDVLAVGRRTRAISPAMERAMKVRDGGTCTFPGCAAHRNLQGHHIVHWADGGSTELSNLASLCPHHHKLMHEGGYGVARTSGRLVFRTPDGRVIEPYMPVPVPRVRVEALNASGAVHVHAGTAWGWDGSPMDYGIAVGNLQRTCADFPWHGEGGYVPPSPSRGSTTTSPSSTCAG